MMVSQSDWLRFAQRMGEIDTRAGNLMREWIDVHGTTDHNALIEYANALVMKYGEASGELACQMYEAIAEAQGVTIQPAEPADIPSYGEVAKAVNRSLKQGAAVVPQAVSRQVKQVGADTTLKNAERDGAQFAWIPSGDTCAFCLTLASRGWQNMSKSAIKGGHAEHIHANCNCQYAIRLDRTSSVQGYDPDKYLEMYENAEGNSSKEKVKSMRREQRYRPIIRGDESGFVYNSKNKFVASRLKGYNEEVYLSQNADASRRDVHIIVRNTKKAMREWGLSPESMPKVVIADTSELGYALGKYDAITNTVYYTPEIARKEIIEETKAVGNIERHEMWHMRQADVYRTKHGEITEGNYKGYIDETCRNSKKNIDSIGIGEYNVGEISEYARVSYRRGRFDEVEAEYMTLARKK